MSKFIYNNTSRYDLELLSTLYECSVDNNLFKQCYNDYNNTLFGTLSV